MKMYSNMLVCGLVAMVAAVGGCPKHTQVATSKVRIGEYDSRSVAVAYAGSERHEAELAKVREAYDKAKADDDTRTVAAIEQKMREAQREAHLQAFCGAPVDNILEQYPEAVADLKTRLGLEALVSKWDEAGLKRYTGAKRIDVTEDLIDVPNPSPRQRASALDIRRHRLVSPEDLPKDDV